MSQRVLHVWSVHVGLVARAASGPFSPAATLRSGNQASLLSSSRSQPFASGCVGSNSLLVTRPSDSTTTCDKPGFEASLAPSMDRASSNPVCMLDARNAALLRSGNGTRSTPARASSTLLPLPAAVAVDGYSSCAVFANVSTLMLSFPACTWCERRWITALAKSLAVRIAVAWPHSSDSLND